MSTVASTPETIEIFFSYSRKDEALCEELQKHLSILQSNGIISSWHDRAIPIGTEWRDEIDEHLNSAQIILLLISPDFLASKYIREREVKRALERHNAGEAVVISIMLRDVDWHGSPLSNLQALPKDALPVTSWPNQDQAFKDIAVGIRKVAERLRHSNTVTITGKKSHQPKEQHAGHRLRHLNRTALYALGSLVIVCLLAALTYTVVHQARIKEIQAVSDWSRVNIGSPLLRFRECMDVKECKDRRQHADNLLETRNWNQIRYDSFLLSDCMAFPQCVERAKQAERLRSVPDWQHISINFPLLNDCMAFPQCANWKQQSDKLRAVTDWEHIPFGSPLLHDCMNFPECLMRRKQADQQNRKTPDDDSKPLNDFVLPKS